MPAIRPLTPADLPRLRRFWIDHWAGDVMIVHGETFRPEQLEGFVAEQGPDWLGLVTVCIRGGGCEILSLDSLQEGQGLGSELMERVVQMARSRRCQRLFLSTTNDNLQALGFYQKRGFEIVAVRRGALAETRRIKPDIPLVGRNGIALRDEIELELPLEALTP